MKKAESLNIYLFFPLGFIICMILNEADHLNIPWCLNEQTFVNDTQKRWMQKASAGLHVS